jgi:molybdenum cofactor sulfurtransferase
MRFRYMFPSTLLRAMCSSSTSFRYSRSGTNLREFEEQNPDYNASSSLASLRAIEFGRLESSKTTYVDYMGGSLYPQSLVSHHYQVLKTGVFGNTHSDSPTCVVSCCSSLVDRPPLTRPSYRSTLSDSHIKAARTAVLDFFGASPDDYTCVFTSNATGALKLVGESYPFSPQSSYVLSADSHNSLNGIRRFSGAAGAEVHYLAACPQGGFDEAEMEVRSFFHENFH